MKSIFVGNLPWSVTDEDLKNKFSEFGNVISARVVSDKFSGKSRGFGFVDMEDSDAEKAIAGLTGYKWGDREITINEARPKSDMGGGGGARRERRF
ncbi:MAG: RNA-binding protein [Candidatus Margulisbacteria bacterium]|jgi:RNA recognition motif-containing protein|nr:RNA-binding protein [Candidatus Margulisiibacteriota bacterium]